MSGPVLIQLDKPNNRFKITCPYWANDVLEQIPNRRWNKTARAWVVPTISANVRAVRTLAHTPGVIADEDVKKFFEEFESKLAALTNRAGKFPPGYQFKTKPIPWQMDCLNHLHGGSAWAIYSEMGTGKTKPVIDELCALRLEGKIMSALIICELSLRRMWQQQWADHGTIDADIFLPTASKEATFLKWLTSPSEFKVMVIGVESLSQGGMYGLAEKFLLTTMRAACVIDESANISNHAAGRSIRAVSLGRMAEYRFAMTGTPIKESPMNLYMQFEFLDPNIIGVGDYYAFRNRYAVMGGFRDPKTGRPREIVGYKNVDELMALIAPCSFQVTKEQAGLNLPPKVYQTRMIQMNPDQKRLYTEMRKSRAIVVNDEPLAMKNILELSMRLHQICGGFTVTKREEHRWTVRKGEHAVMVSDSLRIFDDPLDNPKLAEFMKVIAGAGKRQTITWCVYLPEIEEIAKELTASGRKVGVIHGGVPEDERDMIVRKFQAGEITDVVANTQTAGKGLTMTAAEIVIYYSNSFKLVDRLQSEDRAHRKGQSKSVLYVDLVVENSVDEVVIQALKSKKDMSDYIKGRLDVAISMISGGD